MKPLYITVALAILISGCSSDPPTERQAGSAFEIVQTNFLGTLWNEAQGRASIISQDGGVSFAVPGGAIWAYGDTFKGTRSADGTPHYAGGAVSCAIAFLRKGARSYPPAFQYLVSSNGVVISPFEFLPGEKPVDRYRIWPMGGIYANGHSYLYYSLIDVFGTGPWDFRGVGSGLARATDPLGAYDRLRPDGNWRYPVAPSQVIEAKGWLYLFNVEEINGTQGVGLARVRPDEIEEPGAYEFYAGPGPKFSPVKDAAECLVSNVPGQVSVAWNGYLKKYVMASSSDFSHPREIRFMVADGLAGPWSAPVARIAVPERRQGKRVELVYCTYLHPELFRENGRVMNLTYSLQLADAGFDANCEMAEITVETSKKAE